MNTQTCLRCGSVCEHDSSSGEYLAPFTKGFGHMCKADKTLRCIFIGHKDRLEADLACARQSRDFWEEKYNALYDRHETLKSLGGSI